MVFAAASLRIALALIALVSAAQGELVIVREGTTLYHRPGCPVIRDDAGVLAMTVAQAESRGLKPHPDCDPSKAPERAAGTRGANGRMRTPAKPPAAVSVFVDAVEKQYHRERCPKLGKDPKKIGLDAAAKSYWPCPVCRPPIRARKR